MSQLHPNGHSKRVGDAVITYKRKRVVKRGGTNFMSTLQEAISPKKDAGGSVVAAEEAGASAVGEVRVVNFVNQDTPPSPKYLQASVGILPSPKACKEIEQAGLNIPLALQVDESALIAPKEVEASVAVVKDTGDSAIDEVSDKHCSKRTTKDIGWNHGVPVGGNNYCWKCNWCGIIRWGGVCRLKQHLVGAAQVRKCPKVPEHVAETMRKHLNPGALKVIDARNSHSPRAHHSGSDRRRAHRNGSDRSQSNASRQFSEGSKRLKIGEKQSGTIAQLSKKAAVNVSDKHFSKRRNEDIGWTHGVRVRGNSYCWKCNWCGVVRWGGVCRLKQHLAGVPQVRKCPKVPEYVAQTMRKHLNPGVLKAIDADGRGLDRSQTHASHQYSEGNKCLKIGEKQSETIAKRSKMAAVKASEEPPEAVLPMSSPDGHWRKALEHMLQLPDVKDGGGGNIQSCIHRALRSGPSDQYKENYEVQDQSQKLGSSAGDASDISKSGPCGHAGANISLKCQNILSKILSSKNFVSLCDFIYGTFQEKKATEILDFSLINRRMINGDYERSPELFDQDIEQVWERIRKVSQEMMLLASNLSNISPSSSPKQVTEGMVCEVGEKIFEGTDQASAEQRIPMESNTIQLEISEPLLTSNQPEGLHHDCMVCDRLEVSKARKEADEIGNMNLIVIDSTDSSVSSLQSYELPEPSRTAMTRLCKKCGTCEDDDRRFLICAHTYCPSKFYHIRCLKNSQTACLQKENYSCWYCPSCLCRSCLSDKDDDRIVICDSCDEGYHTYCMTPPLDAVPILWYCISCAAARGGEVCRSCLSDKDDDQIVICDSCDEGYHTYCMTPPLDAVPILWYCISCAAAREGEGTRRYEERQSSEVHRSMDILLSVVEKLSSEYQFSVGKEDR